MLTAPMTARNESESPKTGKPKTAPWQAGVSPRWLWAALAAGLLLRGLMILRFAHVSGDSLVYGDIARNLLLHGTFGMSGDDGARPTLIRLPGYPLLLAACFRVFGLGNYAAVLWVQAVLDLGTCLLLMGTARRLFGERAGMAALWLGVLCPFMANYVAAPLTETVTLAAIALAFYALLRWQQSGAGLDRWVAMLALALGTALLVRPEQGLLAAAVVPAMLAMGRGGLRDRVLPVLLVSALTLAPLVPWTARNWRTFHVFQPLAPRFANDPGEANPAGFQQWYRTWGVDFASTDEVYWNYDGAEIDIRNLPARAFDTAPQRARTAALLEDYNRTTSASPELDLRFAELARERTASHPVRTHLLLPVARLLNMIFRPRLDMLPVDLRWWRLRAHPAQTVFAVGYGLLNVVYLSLAALALVRRRLWTGHRAFCFALVATIVLRCLLLLTIDNSEPRYTLEFYPVLIVLAAGAWAERATSRRACP